MTLLARKCEPLRNHLLGVARCAASLTSALRLELQREAALAGLLHDVGKADEGAQERITRDKGAPGHEVLSALIADRLLKRLKLSTAERFIIVIAILRHHQAIRTLENSLSRLVWLRGLTQVNELAEILAIGLREAGLSVRMEEVASVLGSWPSRRELRGAIKGMWSGLRERYGDPRTCLRARMLTGVLMVADTYVAGSRTKAPRSRYRKEVREFVSCVLGLREQYRA